MRIMLEDLIENNYRYPGRSLAVKYKGCLLHILNSMLVPCGGAFKERKKIGVHSRSSHIKTIVLKMPLERV